MQYLQLAGKAGSQAQVAREQGRETIMASPQAGHETLADGTMATTRTALTHRSGGWRSVLC